MLIDPTESGDRTANLSVIIVSISDVRIQRVRLVSGFVLFVLLKNTGEEPQDRALSRVCRKSQQKKVSSTSQAKRFFVFGYLDTGMTYGKSNKYGKTDRTLDELCEDVFSPVDRPVVLIRCVSNSIDQHPCRIRDDVNSADDA